MDSAVTGRLLGVLRLLWAVSLLVWPRTIFARFGGTEFPESRLVGRILGARHLVQGVAEVTVWPRGRRLGSFVDAAHALSVCAAAIATRRWRKIATIDAAIAASFSLVGTSRAARP